MAQPNNNTEEIIRKPITVSYSESVKGWTSLKSFIPEDGLSVAGNYYTFKDGVPYIHHSHVASGFSPQVNTFYGEWIPSDIKVLLNDMSNVVKSFNTLLYEGSQSRLSKFITSSGGTYFDNRYDNLVEKKGWYVKSIITDKQEGAVSEFIEKEGKWFNYIRGLGKPTLGNIDSREFSYQGVGNISDVDYEGPTLRNYLLIGDWSDTNGINDWAWQWQRYNDWVGGTFIPPWSDYDANNPFPDGYVDTDNPNDNFIVEGSLTNGIAIDEAQIGLKRTIVVRPKTPGSVLATFLAINRMFIVHTRVFNPLDNPPVSTYIYNTPSFRIEPVGGLAPHQQGAAEYDIIPTMDVDGLGFNYFHKPGWPMHLRSMLDDIFITHINVKEIYPINPPPPGELPSVVEITVTLSDFQLDSMVDNFGNSTPQGNRYIPMDIDYYISAPTPILTFIMEVDPIPINGTYQQPNSQQQLIKPSLMLDLDMEDTDVNNVIVPLFNYTGITGIQVGNHYVWSNIHVGGGLVDFTKLKLSTYLGAQITFEETDPYIMDGIFNTQIRLKDNNMAHNDQEGVVEFFSFGNPAWNWPDTTKWDNAQTGVSFLTHLHLLKPDDGFKLTEYSETPPTSSSTTFLLDVEAEGTTPLNWDWTIDIGKAVHDLTETPDPYTIGCMDPLAFNFDPSANVPCSGCCDPYIYGCMDSMSFNYDPNANTPCSATSLNGLSNAVMDGGAQAGNDDCCVPYTYGCTEATADNYNSSANADDGSCFWSACTDDTTPAINANTLCFDGTTSINYALTYGGNSAVVPDNINCCDYVVYPCDATVLDYIAWPVVDFPTGDGNHCFFEYATPSSWLTFVPPGEFKDYNGNLVWNTANNSHPQHNWTIPNGSITHAYIAMYPYTATIPFGNDNFTWQTVWCHTIPYDWVAFASTHNPATSVTNSPWSTSDHPLSYINAIMPPTLGDPATINCQSCWASQGSNPNYVFTSSILNTFVLRGGWTITDPNSNWGYGGACAVARRVTIDTHATYKVTIVIDWQHSGFPGGAPDALIKLGYGTIGSMPWNQCAYPVSPTEEFQDDLGNTQQGNNFGCQSLVDGELWLSQQDYIDAVNGPMDSDYDTYTSKYTFTTSLDPQYVQDTILIMTLHSTKSQFIDAPHFHIIDIIVSCDDTTVVIPRIMGPTRIGTPEQQRFVTPSPRREPFKSQGSKAGKTGASSQAPTTQTRETTTPTTTTTPTRQSPPQQGQTSNY